jgi:PAS domain S-box-containing protein
MCGFVPSVIVVEDNLDHQRAMVEVVRRLGHDVSVVSDGELGLALIAREHPDLVLADVDMPNLDGVQMCREIRADPELAGTPVVLVTALLLPTDPRITGCGARAVLRKPFSFAELAETVRVHLAAPLESGETAADTAAPAFMPALVDALDTGVAACDTAGRLVLYNQALRQFFGDEGASVPVAQWTQHFALHHHDSTPLSPDDLPLARALAGEHVDRAGLLAYDRSNCPAWFRINARPIRDRQGTLLGAVAAVHDITAEHWAEQYEHCRDAVLRVLAEDPDPDTAGRQVLHAVATTLGWPHMRLWLHDAATDRLRPSAIFTAPGEKPLPVPHRIARGQGLAGLCWQRGGPLWIPDIHAPDSPLLELVAEGSDYQAAGAVPVRSGDTITGVFTFFAYRRQNPEPAVGVLLTAVAGHLGAYLAHRRADDLARQLATSVQDYTTLVGHELRTPLTSIGAYTELLAASPDTTTIGEVRDLIEVITRNSDRLRGLIDQLLDLAALESRHAELDSRSVDLTTLATEAVAAVTPLAEQHRIDIHTDLAAHLFVAGDAQRLRQVLDNLLDNAVRYSPNDAHVTVTLTDDSAHAVLTITDTGPGIPTGDQPLMFRRLHRGANARHAGIPGTGLGLPLSRAILALHRGTLTLAPAEPHGVAATVRLPLEIPVDTAGSES